MFIVGCNSTLVFSFRFSALSFPAQMVSADVYLVIYLLSIRLMNFVLCLFNTGSCVCLLCSLNLPYSRQTLKKINFLIDFIYFFYSVCLLFWASCRAIFSYRTWCEAPVGLWVKCSVGPKGFG